MDGKKLFISQLEVVNKQKNDRKLSELINELKKRRFGFFNNDTGDKTIILAQRDGGRRGARFKSPMEKRWPDSFRLTIDEKKVDIMLMWQEDLEELSETEVKDMMLRFIGDEKLSYIQ